MQALYDVAAPAKLNRFLHIVGRRADGYHLLQSVFMLIDWCDRLHFDQCHTPQISREDLNTPLPSDDLILRAARALQQASRTQQGAHIGIEKHIPSQAGMGGGSSDAATTLLALNRLWGLNFSRQQLLHIGLQLGADVPFFLSTTHAWVEGIGEKITPIHLTPGRFLVVKPAAGLDTGLIFSDSQLKRDSQMATIADFVADPSGFGRNDLQSVAQRLNPGVRLALDWLESLGLSGRMTGSGSCVFAPVQAGFALPFELSNVAHPAGLLEVRLCSSLDAHPLSGWADVAV